MVRVGCSHITLMHTLGHLKASKIFPAVMDDKHAVEFQDQSLGNQIVQRGEFACFPLLNTLKRTG